MHRVETFDEVIKYGWVLTANGFENPKRLLFGKKEPSEPPNQEQVDICKKWIESHARPRKTINTKSFSYRLKHRVEEDAKLYIANGAFIKAAVDLGYTEFEFDWRGPNATFKMGLVHKRESNGLEVPLPLTEWPERYLKSC